MNARMMVAAFLLAAAQWPLTASAQDTGYLKSTEKVANIRIGQSTIKEVEDLLGKPFGIERNSRRSWNEWEYRVFAYGQRSSLWISFSDDGIVRDVVQLQEKRMGST